MAAAGCDRARGVATVESLIVLTEGQWSPLSPEALYEAPNPHREISNFPFSEKTYCFAGNIPGRIVSNGSNSYISRQGLRVAGSDCDKAFLASGPCSRTCSWLESGAWL